jgi:hypothetical protein
MAGFDVAALSKRPVRAKIAGLLPLPAFLKRRWSGAADDRPGAAAAHHSGALAQISTAAGQYADPVMGGWAKAAAAAATIALAGVGAGVATHGGALGIGGGSNAPATARPAATRPARAAAPAKHAPRTGGSVTATRSARSTSTTTHLPRSRAGAGSSPNASSSPGSSGTTTVGGTTAAVTTSTPAAAGGTATPILDTVQKTLTPGRPPTGGGRPGPSASGSSPSVDVPTSLTPLPKMAPLPDPAQTVTGVVDTATGSGGSGGGTLGGVTNTVGNLVGGG